MSYTIELPGMTWSQACLEVHRHLGMQVIPQRDIETYYGIKYVNPDGIKDTVTVTFLSEAHYAFFLLKAF
jgi:hypothetical protein